MSDNKELNENELKEDKIKSILLNISEEEDSESDEINEEEDKRTSAGKWIRGIIIALILIAVVPFAVVSIFFSKKTYTGYETVVESAKNLPEGSGYVTDYGKILCYKRSSTCIYDYYVGFDCIFPYSGDFRTQKG